MFWWGGSTRVIDKKSIAENDKTKIDAKSEIISTPQFIVGKSKPIVKLNEEIASAIKGSLRIIIEGESGSGKENVAEAIAKFSARGPEKKPYRAINCSVFENTALALTQMFGAFKGAYTDCIEDMEGDFALCRGGTIFLDEIQDLKIEVQGLLKRYLETYEFSPLGTKNGKRMIITSNVRLISATNVNLLDMIKENKFLHDLYYRLAQRTITVPPLREIKEDIPEIAIDMLRSEKFAIEILGKEGASTKFYFKNGCEIILTDFFYPNNKRSLFNLLLNAANEALPTSGNLASVSEPIEIREEHLIKAAKYAQVDISPLTSPYNISPANNAAKINSQTDAENFLDQVERILSVNFNNYKIVSQEKLCRYFLSRDGKLGIRREVFSHVYFVPLKNSCKSLLEKFPNRWEDARKKCAFIKRLDND
ncbi:MAG: sigma-54-dependent Fis family transcriptional regulator [Bacteroidetes bacterium]|nr:sigma-54-dependent Fis family transcriptional regulator [Bacteroidota bacterium]